MARVRFKIPLDAPYRWWQGPPRASLSPRLFSIPAGPAPSSRVASSLTRRSLFSNLLRFEGLDQLGMVIDFDDLRALVRKAVLDRWDRATLLWSEDPLVEAIERVQDEVLEKVVRLAGNPTVENLMREASQAISQSLPPGIRIERVVIRETPTCLGELTRDQA